MTGIELINEERQEHFTKHARLVMDDVAYNDKYQLIQAAAIMILPFEMESDEDSLEMRESIKQEAPEGWNLESWRKMIDKPYRERLIIAGSLIAAELDRLTELDYRLTSQILDE
jgi:hypothetical protein